MLSDLLRGSLAQRSRLERKFLHVCVKSLVSLHEMRKVASLKSCFMVDELLKDALCATQGSCVRG